MDKISSHLAGLGYDAIALTETAGPIKASWVADLRLDGHLICSEHSFTHFYRQALQVPKHAKNVNNALVAALGPTELPGPAGQRYR